MYCRKCGKPNPKNSNFCQYCGADLNPAQPSSQNQRVAQFSNAYPIKKFTIMLVITYGVYFLYWFERNWRLIKQERQSNISPFWRTIGLFVPFLNFYLIYEQFKEIKKLAEENGIKDTYSPGWSMVGYVVVNLFSLGFLSPFVLNRIQSTFNKYWQTKQPSKEIKTRFSWKESLALLFFLGIYVLIFLGLMYPTEDYNTDYSATTNTVSEVQPTTAPYNQTEIASSVVNILCPSIIEGEEGSGGSGTIITEDGVILTNSHIIPQDEEYINVDEKGCIVILPDPTTGQPREMYWATPIVLPEISDAYDLAYLYIQEVYYDEETGEPVGTYPNTFPSFDDSNRCVDESVKLGEKVTIFGYPSLSGGLSLTVTDGLVSSFPGDGLIVTSAKISEGNSGGLAVDEHGCMIGVPSMVSYDETESLGVIISADLIYEFSDEVSKYLEDY
jgi:hypothetical protein